MSQAVLPTVQKRSEQTRNKLLAAVRKLLLKKDFEDIAVTEIAREAGVAVGTVYRRFENKDAFIPAIVSAYQASLEAIAAEPRLYAERHPEAALVIEDDMDLRQALEKMALLMWSQLIRERGLMRLVFLTARTRPELLEDKWESIEQAQFDQTRELLQHFKADIAHRNLDEATAIILAMMTAPLIDKALFPERSPGFYRKIDGESLARELGLAAHAWLVSID